MITIQIDKKLVALALDPVALVVEEIEYHLREAGAAALTSEITIQFI